MTTMILVKHDCGISEPNPSLFLALGVICGYFIFACLLLFMNLVCQTYIWI